MDQTVNVATPESTGSAQTKIPEPGSVVFYTVAEVAAMFRIAPLTLYRAIQTGEFPGLKIRRRYVIPAGPIDAMRQHAATGRVFDPMDFVRRQVAEAAAEGGVAG